MFYAVMNNYSSSLIPRYLHALVDDKLQVNASWDYDSSAHSYPYYMADPECPDELYLLCRKNVGALRFSYYNHGVGHIISDDLQRLLASLRVSRGYTKRLIATSIGNGEVLRSDLHYLWLVGDEGLIDIERSRIEEDRRGMQVPLSLTFNDKARDYDVFTIRGTVLGGFLFVSADVVSQFEKLRGVKIVPADELLAHYCKDYRYDLQANKKKPKPKLP